MAELADALDLGSSGTPVQVQVLSPAPKMDACRTAIKHLFHFWGGTPVLDVCYANQVLFRLRRMLLPAPDTEDCFTEIKHLFHFWGGTPVLDVCIRKPSLVSPMANVTARTRYRRLFYRNQEFFHFWGGTPVLDVCIRKPSLVSPMANVTARTKQYSTNPEQSGFVLFLYKRLFRCSNFAVTELKFTNKS